MTLRKAALGGMLLALLAGAPAIAETPSDHAMVNVPPPGAKQETGGGLSQKEVSAVIRKHLNEVRHCYETLLTEHPKAQGKLNAHFVVGKTGKVNVADVNDSTFDPPDSATIGACIQSKIMTWEFPKPRGGEDVTVNYPFVFNPL